MRLDQLSVDKLMKYAVLLHDVLASYDLAHVVLAALDCRVQGDFSPKYLARLTAATPASPS